MGLLVAGLPALSAAQPPAEAPPGRRVGGHVGLALPLVFIDEDDTEYVGDRWVIATPIGIGWKLTDRLVVDFETIVQNPVDPSGTTSLVVDPGLIYNFGPFAAGLRIASEIGADANVGLIPLINKGLVDLGGGTTWFVEAAFPTFVHATPPDFTMNIVFHTGIGF
jgi:hypothetical protein